MFLQVIMLLFTTLLFTGAVYAGHPLITDDTGTGGKGNAKIKTTMKFDHDDVNGTVRNSENWAFAVIYGVSDVVNIEIAQPYKFKSGKKANGSKTKTDGISDASIELKWRFYEKDNLGFALRPSITLPTGDYKKGLGNGKATYSLFFITTKELNPWVLHFNAGYKRNENKADECVDLWQLSTAAEVEVAKGLKLAGDIGLKRNVDKASNIHPAYILGGAIYSITKNLKVTAGVKRGLNKAEPDYSLLSGMTVKF